jgi:hypothetical protein
MTRRLPRLLLPIMIAAFALVLAMWVVTPSMAEETPPPGPAPSAPEFDPELDLPTPKYKPPMYDIPQGPKDCASCTVDDPA